MTCPVCGHASKFESGFSDVIIYRCSGCSHCFSDEARITNLELYQEDYYEEKHKNWFNTPNMYLFKNIYKVLDQYKSVNSVLDVGCGKGHFLKYVYLKNPNIELVGIDKGQASNSNNVEIIDCDIFEYEPMRKFDAVVSLAVIEHVADPNMFIQKLKSLCNKHGIIVIMTVNENSIVFAISKIMNKMALTYPFERLYDRHHLNHFTDKSLAKLLEKNELHVIKTIKHGVPWKSVDFENKTLISYVLFKVGLCACFIISSLTGKYHLQTIICQNSST